MNVSAPSTDEHHCRRCGACCRWEGDVCLTQADVQAISAYLHVTEEDFINTCCRLQRNRQGLSLIDANDGACCMLREDNTCSIQSVKPQQCRDFPQRWNFPGWEQRCPAAKKGGTAC